MQKHVISIHSLLAAVISRAIEDLKEAGPRGSRKEPDRAMAFILSGDCEAYCLELEIDYETVKEKATALYCRIIEKEESAARYPKRRRVGGYQVTSLEQFPRKKRLPLHEAGLR
jgi:hypothetical protein